MNDLEKQAIMALIKLAVAAMDAMENSEGRTEDVEVAVIFDPWIAPLNAALDELDALPDDRPGYVMSVAAKAQWALRGLLDTSIDATLLAGEQ